MGGQALLGRGDIHLIKVDTFTRADSADVGDAWNSIVGPAQIVGNRVRATNLSFDNIEQWVQSNFSSSQFSEITLATISGTSQHKEVAAGIRNGIGLNSMYLGKAVRNDEYYGTKTTVLIRRDNGADAVLSSESATTWAATDILRIQGSEQTIRLYRNDVLLLTAVDATYGSGTTSMQIYQEDALANVEIESWRGGDIPLSFTDYSDFPKPKIRQAWRFANP